MDNDIVLPPSLRFIERDWLSSNHLLGLGGDDNVLVDSGYCSRRDLTLQLVGHALNGRRLDRIVNTHTHSDHVGGNAALKARYGCRLFIPLHEREAIEGWQEEKLHYATLGQACDRFCADDYYDHGDILEIGGLGWQAIGSPGHDMDSLLLYQPEHRLLVSADALWEQGFGIVFPEFFDEPGFAAQEATLRAIEALAVDVVIPGHGRMFRDFHPALERARQRLAYFRANPERHAFLGMKVGLSFMLLDRGRLRLDELETTYGELPLIQRINRKYFRKDTPQLTRDVLESLLSSRVARTQAGWLVPAA
jgi:glyoxylase-like metal-dependent hydrolase (beta-lactamase superfamily II)